MIYITAASLHLPLSMASASGLPTTSDGHTIITLSMLACDMIIYQPTSILTGTWYLTSLLRELKSTATIMPFRWYIPNQQTQPADLLDAISIATWKNIKETGSSDSMQILKRMVELWLGDQPTANTTQLQTCRCWLVVRSSCTDHQCCKACLDEVVAKCVLSCWWCSCNQNALVVWKYAARSLGCGPQLVGLPSHTTHNSPP